MANAFRYLDVVLLVLALPVFIAADFPIAGWLLVAGVWVIQYAIEITADRRSARALSEGNRNAAMGWIGATTLARVWIIALGVLLIGILDSKDAGLAAAVLSAILFTVHFGARVLGRLFSQESGEVS